MAEVLEVIGMMSGHGANPIFFNVYIYTHWQIGNNQEDTLSVFLNV